MSQKIILITGASRGLGKHLSLQLAQTDARVIACARDAQQLEALAEHQPNIHPYPLDLCDSHQIRQVVAWAEAEYGRIDVLINNAGVGLYQAFHQQDLASLQQQIQVNFSAVVELCHAVLPGMLKQQSGHILNLGSDLARRPLANMAVYSACKHALAGFSHSLLREVKNQGIKVSLINPGIIDTCFGGGEEGSRDERWSLQPAVVAKIIIDILNQPGYTLIDEISLHPLQQDF